MIRVLAETSLSWHDDLWITDATPVPCNMSREMVKRSDPAGHAGRCVWTERFAVVGRAHIT